MKKILSLALSLVLMSVGVAALAETETQDVTIEITFGGEYVTFEDFGFMLMLPTDWEQYETDDLYLYVANADQTQGMGIDVIETDGSLTLDAAAAQVAEQLEIEGVYGLMINDIDFYLYELPDQNAMGAFSMTGDGYLIHFIFSPFDEDMSDLATQIMASIQNVEA